MSLISLVEIMLFNKSFNINQIGKLTKLKMYDIIMHYYTV